MRIRNINGTSQRDCKCGSWLQHWKNFSKQSLPLFCPVVQCYEKPEVGAHVQRDVLFDNNWYIIPLCKNHNAKRGETLTVRDDIKLVSANVNETCGS